MSVNSYLTRYRELLAERCDTQKRLADLEMEVQLMEKEMEFAATSISRAGDGVHVSERQAFIDDHRADLEPDDLEFLELPYRGPSEVSAYSQISASSLKRLANAGTLDIRRTEAGHRRYSTVSVVRYLITEREESQ